MKAIIQVSLSTVVMAGPGRIRATLPMRDCSDTKPRGRCWSPCRCVIQAADLLAGLLREHAELHDTHPDTPMDLALVEVSRRTDEDRSDRALAPRRLLCDRRFCLGAVNATPVARSPEREKNASYDEGGKQCEQHEFRARSRKWQLKSIRTRLFSTHGYEADGCVTHRLWQ